jgi:hypothetical protein
MANQASVDAQVQPVLQHTVHLTPVVCKQPLHTTCQNPSVPPCCRAAGQFKCKLCRQADSQAAAEHAML